MGSVIDCEGVARNEQRQQPTTKHRDLWVLGSHKLLCADSAKAEDVDRLLDGAPIHLVNTDPPYGVKVKPRSNNAIAAGSRSAKARAWTTALRCSA